MKVFKTTLAILAVKAAAQEEPKYGGAIAPGLPSYDQPSNAAPLSTIPTIPPGYAKSSTHLASSVASYTPSSAPPQYTPPEYSRHPTPGSSQAPSPSAPLPPKYGHSDATSRTAPAYIPSSKALSAAESSTPLPTYKIPCYGPQCTSGASSAARSETLTIPKYGVPSSAVSSTVGISTTAKAPIHSVQSSAVSSNAKSSLLPVPSYKAPSSAVSSAVGSTTANVPTYNAHSTANLSTYKAPSATPYHTVVSSALTSIPNYEKSSHIPSSTDNPTPYAASTHGNPVPSSAASSHVGPVHTSLPTYAMTLSPSKYTTEVVSRLTTYCPSATTITHGGQTYTVTSATTLTITNCPCTVTKPVYNAPVPTSAPNSAISSHGTSSVSTVPAYKPVTTIKTYTSLTSCSAGQELTTVLTSDITSTVTATSTITLVSTPVSAPAVTITKQTTFVSTTVCTAGQTIKTTATRGFESSIMITATETITAAVAPKPAVPSTITAQVTETHYLTCTAGQTVTEKGKPSVVTSGYVSTIPVYKTVTYISTPSDVPSKTPITQITSDDSTTVVTATLDSTVQSTILINAPTSTIEASSEHSGPPAPSYAPSASYATPPAYEPPSSYASLPSETVNPAPYPLPSSAVAYPPMGTGNAPMGTAPASSLVQYSPTATPITYHGSASRKRRSFGMGLGLLTSIASILLM